MVTKAEGSIVDMVTRKVTLPFLAKQEEGGKMNNRDKRASAADADSTCGGAEGSRRVSTSIITPVFC